MKQCTDFALPFAALAVVTTAITACLAVIASGSHIRHKGDVTVVVVEGAELRNGIVRDSRGRSLGNRHSANTTYRAKHAASAKSGKDEMSGHSLIVIDLP